MKGWHTAQESLQDPLVKPRTDIMDETKSAMLELSCLRIIPVLQQSKYFKLYKQLRSNHFHATHLTQSFDSYVNL